MHTMLLLGGFGDMPPVKFLKITTLRSKIESVVTLTEHSLEFLVIHMHVILYNAFL